VDSASTSPLRIGVIGQGVSTIAAFGEAGDVIRFYEIDARVSEIANTYFTYLSDSKADTIVVIGDARISMESELTAQQYQGYDVLAVDAFSGDGIPVHLLTREALSLYRQHMTPQGVIAIHISNRHFDLRSVVRSLASDAGMHASWITDSGDKRVGEKINDWVLLTGATGLQKQLETKATKWPEGDFERMLWTDDYANVLAALWRE
jgi:spermidine synthase